MFFFIALGLFYTALEIWGRSSVLLGVDQENSPVNYNYTTEDKNILQEAYLVVLKNNPTLKSTEESIAIILSEEMEDQAWRGLIRQRLLKGYLKKYIIQNNLQQESIREIETRLSRRELILGRVFLFGLICIFGFGMLNTYLDHKIIYRNEKDRKTTGSFTVYNIMLLTGICISISLFYITEPAFFLEIIKWVLSLGVVAGGIKLWAGAYRDFYHVVSR
jgi:hypothetical protein